jgi:hypothetical protein
MTLTIYSSVRALCYFAAVAYICFSNYFQNSQLFLATCSFACQQGTTLIRRLYRDLIVVYGCTIMTVTFLDSK